MLKSCQRARHQTATTNRKTSSNGSTYPPKNSRFPFTLLRFTAYTRRKVIKAANIVMMRQTERGHLPSNAAYEVHGEMRQRPPTSEAVGIRQKATNTKTAT